MVPAVKMKRPFTFKRIGLIFGMILIALLFSASTASSKSVPIPKIYIDSVVADQTVTLHGHNFPAGATFNVRMGEMGTKGVGGIIVDTTTPASSTFTATYTIPEALKGRYQIAIRLDGYDGYYSFNWFYNNTTGPVTSPGATGGKGVTPTMSIDSVKKGESVTFTTHNYPANYDFVVTMGKMYTRGIDGIKVGEFNSGAGGSLTKTFNIPSELKDEARISIRASTAHANPYYSFNWFHNNDAPATSPTPTPEPTPDPGAGTGGLYTGIPTFKICEVDRNNTVKIVTNNFPPNQTFTVKMGPMYSRGIGGIVVETFDSEGGGTLTKEFTIPADLHDSYKIAIRAETSHPYPYAFFAYNWFYNNDANVCQ